MFSSGTDCWVDFRPHPDPALLSLEWSLTWFPLSEASSLGDPPCPDPVWQIQCLRISIKLCSGYSKYLKILGNSPRHLSLLFYLFFLDDLIYSQNPNYHLYANDYQIYISNPRLSLELQIGTPNCLIYMYFECLTDISNLACQKSKS